MLKTIRNCLYRAGVILPLLFFTALLLLFSFERLAIRLFLPGHFAGCLTVQTVHAMLVGLRFDIVIAATLACPLITLSAAGRLCTRRRFLKVVSVLTASTLGIVIFLCIADFYFFEQFGERLNHKALVYLDSDYVYKIIWNDYPMITVAIFVCLSILVAYKLLMCLLAGTINCRAMPERSSFEVVVTPALMIALTVYGIRGTLGPKAINTGPAYFCSPPAISQLTLNGLFTLREAAISLAFRAEEIAGSYTPLLAGQAVKNALSLIAQPHDTFCATPSNPLRRITDSGAARHDYNVVLVILESLSWHYIGSMGADPGYTPNFDRLVSGGLLMDECFCVGDRTTRGFGAVVASYPDLLGKSVTTRPQSEKSFFTLGSVLKSRGYETMFIYAGQPWYDHRQAFLASNGYTKMVFQKDFAARTFKTRLGYCDHDLYDQALLEFDKSGDKPFFATLLTLSFHRDFRIPPGKVTPEQDSTPFHEQIDAIRYTDWAIGRFISKAAAADCFENTIFVFVADHMGGFKEAPVTAASHRVPFLIYAPQIVKPGRITEVCSQLDVAPTIMHLLGGSYEHCFFGSSVLARERGSGFAWTLDGGQLTFINGLRQGVVLSPGDSYSFFTFTPPNTLDQFLPDSPKDLLRPMPLSILQVANDIFEKSAYNLDSLIAAD